MEAFETHWEAKLEGRERGGEGRVRRAARRRCVVLGSPAEGLGTASDSPLLLTVSLGTFTLCWGISLFLSLPDNQRFEHRALRCMFLFSLECLGQSPALSTTWSPLAELGPSSCKSSPFFSCRR